MPAPLTQVRASLGGAAPPLAAVSHVTDLVSGFLDASLVTSPPRAAASGSVRLFERVAARQLDATGVDPIIRDNLFARALEAAIQVDDLAMVQAIHMLHPEPLDARSLKLAMAHGSLELAQWVVANRHDRVCCEPGVTNLCRGCAELAAQWLGGKDTFRIATWLLDARVLSVSDGADTSTCSLSANAALLKSAEFVRWCDAKGLLSAPMIDRLMRDTLQQPNRESAAIARYFLERDYIPSRQEEFVDALIAASCRPDQEDLVQCVLDSKAFDELRSYFVYASLHAGGAKVLQWDNAYKSTRGFMGMGAAIAIAGASGHMATMRWLVEARDVTTLKPPVEGVREQDMLELLTWLHGTGSGRWTEELMDSAASNGQLQVVQWLHQNRSEQCSPRAMDSAAANGHLAVVQWLHQNRSEGCTHQAINVAAGNGHADVVAWLHLNRSEGSLSTATAFAAANGQLDLVRWCLDHGGCARCVRMQLLAQPLTYTVSRFAGLDIRVLASLKWLDAYGSTSAIHCRGECVATVPHNALVNLAAAALGSGDILLLTYLHEHHSDLFAWQDHHRGEVMNAITWQGHLPVVQWLHARYPNNLDWLLLADDAAARDQNEVAEWLRALPRSE